MILGPFTLSDVRRLQETLEAHGVVAELVPDPSAGHQAREQSKRQVLTTHPTYQGIAAHLYLDIPEEHLQTVAQDLLYMGFLYKPEEPVLGEDYLCTECDYHSLDRGICPKHYKPLVDFSTWNARRKKRSDRRTAYFWFFFFAVLIIFLISHHYFGRNW